MLQKLFISVVLMISITSCATMSDVIKNKDKGTVVVYPVTKEQALKIARQVFLWEGTDAVEYFEDNNLLLTSSNNNGFSSGTFMGAWVDPTDENNTKVTIVTKRKQQLDLYTTLTESTFHRRFAQAVEFIKEGKPMPLTPPKLIGTKVK